MRPTKARMMGIAALLAVGLVATACGSGTAELSGIAAGTAQEAVADAEDVLDPVAFRDDMRVLWEDHIVWTRMFIVSAAAGLPDTGVAAERLLRNQDDIGDAVAEFYGERTGERLTALLREHILIAADLVGAAKAGEEQEVERLLSRWYRNGDQIAAFLSRTNPNWHREHMEDMMRAHLDATLEEATARLQGDWEADVAAYERIHEDILAMADGMSGVIIAHLPERF